MQINSTELDGAPFEFLLLSTEEDLNTGCLAVLNYVKTSLYSVSSVCHRC